MSVQKRSDESGSPFNVLVPIAYMNVPAFDYLAFVGENEWLLDLVAAAGKAGGFTEEVVRANTPDDFQKGATKVDVVNLIEFMNMYSEKQGWPSLVDLGTVPEPSENEKPKRKYRPRKKKTAKRTYTKRRRNFDRRTSTKPPTEKVGMLPTSKTELIEKFGSAQKALDGIQAEVDKAGSVYRLSKRLKVKAFVLYNVMSALRKEAAGETPKPTRRRTGIHRKGPKLQLGSRKPGRSNKMRDYLGTEKSAKEKLIAAGSVVALAKLIGSHPNSLTTFFHKEYGVKASDVLKKANKEGVGRGESGS
ncbi:MAG: hypothetical protein WCT27_01890 [Patescibacteria group bacterium]|jgi:hypothetical protein